MPTIKSCWFFTTAALATSIMALNILISAPTLKELPGFQDHPKTFSRFEIVGFALLAGVALAAWIAFRVRKNPGRAARLARRASERSGSGLAGPGGLGHRDNSHRVYRLGCCAIAYAPGSPIERQPVGSRRKSDCL